MSTRLSEALTLSGFAILASTAISTGASAATITGTMNKVGFAYAYTSSDFKYNDGKAYATDIVTLICLVAWAEAPENGSTHTFDAGYGAEALWGGGGALGIAGVHYLVDKYYDDYFTNGTNGTQWAFQQVVWELGSDYKEGSLETFDPHEGHGAPSDPAYDNVNNTYADYAPAWQLMYADLGAALATLDVSYRSTKYTLDFLNGLKYGDVQNFVAIQELPSVAPVPVPAGLPLVLSGLAAFGYVARRKRR